MILVCIYPEKIMEKLCHISNISDTHARNACFEGYKNNHTGILKIEYESRYENTRILREIIDEFCAIFEIPPKWRTRIVLIYDELNNNAIEHGSISSDTNMCFISLEKKEDSIILEWYVEDTWKSQDAKSPEELRNLKCKFEWKDFSKHHSIRWRWLFLIISQLVNSLEFSRAHLGWVRVCFKKIITLD